MDEISLASLRVDLAAAFRIAARMDWHESVGNHFSLAVSQDGKRFLMNPRWRHFELIRASDLLLLDSTDESTMSRPDAPDPTAWCIHGSIHAALPRARCVLHLHPPYATALATLADMRMPVIDQNTARFHGRLAYDTEYGGMADTREEGARLVRALGDKRFMIMGSHGVLVTAPTVAEAFEDMYFLERAARTVVLAYSTGKPLRELPADVADATVRCWDDYNDSAFAHFRDLKALLDRSDPSYRD